MPKIRTRGLFCDVSDIKGLYDWFSKEKISDRSCAKLRISIAWAEPIVLTVPAHCKAPLVSTFTVSQQRSLDKIWVLFRVILRIDPL